MGALDSKLLPGASVTVNADYHNDLVDKLRSIGSQQTVKMIPSTTRAVVDPGDDSLLPSSVAITDTTDWRGLTRDNLYIAASLSGVGQISTVGFDPNSSITWSYPTADWDGGSLPNVASITFTPYVLTADTNGASVADTTALAALVGVTDGERRVVRANRSVYLYDAGAGSGDILHGAGGYWNEEVGPNWSALTAQTIDITIEQAHDPDFTAALFLNQAPEADYLRMTGGVGRVGIQDLSEFPASVTSVSRTVTAVYIDENDVSIGSDGITITNGDEANWLGDSDRSFLVEGINPGRIKITSTYSYSTGGPNTDIEYTRVIRIGAPDRTWRTAEDTPINPKLRITPNDGFCHFRLGTAVKLDTFTKVGTAVFDSTLPPSQDLVRNLAARLSISGSVDAEGHRAFAAAEAIRSILTGGIGGRVNEYEMTLLAVSPDTSTDLLNVSVGQMVYFPGGAVKIKEILTSGIEITDEGNESIRVSGYGLFEGAVDEEGWISSNADLMTITMEFGYGDQSANDFPRYTFFTENVMSPLGSLPETEIPLPLQIPTTMDDGWYVRTTVSSYWIGGEVTTSTTSWTRAEKLPTGEPTLSITRDGDSFIVDIGGTSNFYGRIYWSTEAILSGTAPSNSTALGAKQPMPTRQVMALTADQYAEPRMIVVDGHFRSRAGTANPTVQRVISSGYTPVGSPVQVLAAEPTNPAPSTNGIWATYNSEYWVSLNGSWIKQNPTADAFYTQTEIDNAFYTKAAIDADNTGRYTKDEADAKFATASTTYTKTEIDAVSTGRYTKAEADAKFATIDNTYTQAKLYTRTESDANFYKKSDVYTKNESDNNYYRKSDVDAQLNAIKARLDALEA